MAGHHRQRRQQRQRIEINDVATLACQRAARHVTLADAEAVGEKDQVAFAAFGSLGGMDVMGDADAGIGGDVGMPPACSGSSRSSCVLDVYAPLHLRDNTG
jgi:hypothetical protein